MQKNNLKTKNRKFKKLVGRGGLRGKTSGRGHKGQKARSGHKIRPEYRDVIKRMPKLRGRGKNIFQSPNKYFVTIKTDVLEKNFSNGDLISPKILNEKGLLSNKDLKNGSVKIVQGQKLTKKFKLEHCAFSKALAGDFEIKESKDAVQ